MLLVTLALKTLLSISQNGINQIALNKQLGNRLNADVINGSSLQVQNTLAYCAHLRRKSFIALRTFHF